MTTIGEYYRVLGVASDAQTDDIKKSFRKLARSCHPDVAGDDPQAAEQFARIREAYETLSDPERRAQYDLRIERAGRRPSSKSHIRTHWRPPGGWDGFSGHSKVRAARRSEHQKTEVSLEDIFADPGGATADFGFGAKDGGAVRSDDDAAEIVLKVEVPGRTARSGDTVTARYNRLRRSSDGVNVYNYPEIYDLRVPPRTCTGDTLRSERMGNFSKRSNLYADLVCRLTVLEESGTHHPRRDAQASDAHKAGPVKEGKQSTDEPTSTVSNTVCISLVEAVLGGRVRVSTPKGDVNVSIPPGTSSGKRLRLKNKGHDGDDWHVRVEIVVPKTIDSESRQLIERFGTLNPMGPDSE